MKKQTIKCKAWSWGRYRYRLFKIHEDSARDFNSWRTLCFKHRVEQSICHCSDNEYHFVVTPKIAIPRKADVVKWRKLEVYLKEFGDYPEHNNYRTEVSINKLTKEQRLLNKLCGVIPTVYIGR